MPWGELSLFFLIIIQNQYEKNAEFVMLRKMVVTATTVLKLGQ